MHGKQAGALCGLVLISLGAHAFHVVISRPHSLAPQSLRPAAPSPWLARPAAFRARGMCAAAHAQKNEEAEAPPKAEEDAAEGEPAEAVESEAQPTEEAAPDPHAELRKAVADLENSVFSAERRLSAAREAVKEKGKTGFLRIAAEVDNFRKRRGADKVGLERRAMADVVKAFAPVLEAFESAQAELELSTDEERKFAKSYSAMETQLREELTKLGMAQFFAAQSEKYDSLRHDKVEERHSADLPAGTVLECLAPGMEVGGFVAKKAKCVVSLGKEGEATAAPEAPAEEVAEEVAEGAADEAAAEE